MKYYVLLNGSVVAIYLQKKRALNKALELAKCGKYTKHDDSLCVQDSFGNRWRYL